MSFFDDASLVMIPSGYKASKVYSVKPTDGTGDLTFSRASTATRVNASGLIASVASNVPRLDYTNSTCPKLLLEPQRTNLAQYSEQFDNVYWLKSNATITANTTVSPDGTQNADTAVITAGGYIYAEFFPYAAVTGQSATISVFAKSASGELVFFGGATTAGTDVYKIENYGNGWYRHSRVRTFTATASTTLQYIISSVGTFIIWGAQVEGSNSGYATSYIPTLGASVTRVADACSKTSATALIGQTEGTFFAEVTLLGSTGNFNVLNTDNVTTNAITLHIESGQVRGYVYANSVLYNDITGGSISVGNTYKMAYAYKSGDAALYLNGVQIGTASQTWAFSASVGKIEVADIDTYFSYQEGIKFAQALLFKTRLTNAQLAELTA